MDSVLAKAHYFRDRGHGYTPGTLADANRSAIHLLEEIREEYETGRTRVVISGCLGPRGDGYVLDRAMSVQEPETYHRAQVETFAGSAVAISFTVETDGISRLAST
jgi:homocysteine S-methyltransferase